MKAAFVGDLALGDHPKTIGYGIGSTYGRNLPVEKIKRVIPATIQPDLVFGNLEYPLYEWDKVSADNSVNQNCCRGFPEYADALASGGINIVNVANNHIFQHGTEAFDSTITALSKAGIKTCGLPSDLQGQTIIEHDGLSLGMLAFSDRPRQYNQAEPPYNEFDLQRCCDAIKTLKARCDVVCVSIHWGDEFILLPSPKEREIARQLIDSGAALVVGHHPHVIREVETYKDGLIAYSLGNTICDMFWNPDTAQAACLEVNFGQAGVTDWVLHLGEIDKDYFPNYLSGADLEQANEVLQSRFSQLQDDVEQQSYEQVSLSVLKHHEKLTLKAFLKNIYRVKKSVLFDIFFHAISRRVLALLGR